MVWTAPATYTTGQIVTAANLNTYLRDNMTWRGQPPQFSVHLAGLQSLASGSLTTVIFDTDDVDPFSGYNLSTGVYTVPANCGGLWLLSAGSAFTSNGTGVRTLEINSSGALCDVTVSASEDSLGRTAPSVLAYLSAGATVAVRAIQNSGGALNLNGNNFFRGVLVSQ